MEVSNSALPFAAPDLANQDNRREVAAKQAQVALMQPGTGMSGSPIPGQAVLANTVISALRAAAASNGGLAVLLSDLVQIRSVPVVPAEVQVAIASVLEASAPLKSLTTEARIAEAFTNLDKIDGPPKTGAAKSPSVRVSANQPVLTMAAEIKTALVSLKVALQSWSSSLQLQPQSPPVQILTTPPSGVPSAPAPLSLPADDLNMQQGAQSNALTSTNSSIPAHQYAPPGPAALAQVITKTDPALTLVVTPPQLFATQSAPLLTSAGDDMADAMVSLLLLQQAAKPSVAVTNRSRTPSLRADTLTQPEMNAQAAGGPSSLYRRSQTSIPVQPPARWTGDADASVVARTLSTRTENALNQVKLLEVAAQIQKPDDRPPSDARDPSWNFELPVSTPHGDTKAKFEVNRDTCKGRDGEQVTVWRARLSIDVEPLGPVHAQIALLNKKAWISLWTEREASMRTLEAHRTLLQQTFSDESVSAEIICCVGSPAVPQRTTGSLLDNSI
ncbi:MAG: flagellar hook-length control protein FliK [Micropepsaceae bacterium]